jgi:hypothetical protein
MKMLIRSALLALSMAGITAAQAQYSSPDLVLGFTGGTAGSDVLFDLGSASTIGSGGTQTVDLSGSFSASLLGNNGYSSLSGKSFGVIGYTSGVNSGIYSTTAGSTPSVVPNHSAWNGISLSIDNTGSLIDGSGSPANSAVVAASNPNSWSANVANPGFNTYYNNYGNPDVTIGSGVTDAELYFAKANGSAPQLLGTIAIDPNADTLTFTPTETPEPGTMALMGVASVMGFAFRRFFRRNS